MCQGENECCKCTGAFFLNILFWVKSQGYPWLGYAFLCFYCYGKICCSNKDFIHFEWNKFLKFKITSMDIENILYKYIRCIKKITIGSHTVHIFLWLEIQRVGFWFTSWNHLPARHCSLSKWFNHNVCQGENVCCKCTGAFFLNILFWVKLQGCPWLGYAFLCFYCYGKICCWNKDFIHFEYNKVLKFKWHGHWKYDIQNIADIWTN